MSRIAIFTNFIPPYRKSFYERLSELVAGDITFYLSANTELNRKWEVDWGQLKVKVQKSFKIKYKWKQKKDFKEDVYMHFPIDTLSILLKSKPTTIVSAEFGLRTLLCCLYKFFFPKVKFIIWATVSSETDNERGYFRKMLRKFILKFPSTVFTNGQSGINYIQSLSASKTIDIVRIPYTIDESLFYCDPVRGFAEEGYITLLYTGHISTRKGIIPAIRILSNWCNNNMAFKIKLKMVGNIELKNFDEAIGIVHSNILLEVVGHVAYNQLKQYYNQADFLLFPTFADEWGVVVNESMAAGVPVIGSIYSQAVLEMVKEGYNGYIIDIHQPSSLHAAMNKISKLDKKTFLEMRKHASKSLHGFDLQTIAKRFCDNLN
jgi:glycosyltransferase involved in cell wall biosynthesis